MNMPRDLSSLQNRDKADIIAIGAAKHAQSKTDGSKLDTQSSNRDFVPSAPSKQSNF